MSNQYDWNHVPEKVVRDHSRILTTLRMFVQAVLVSIEHQVYPHDAYQVVFDPCNVALQLLNARPLVLAELLTS